MDKMLEIFVTLYVSHLDLALRAQGERILPPEELLAERARQPDFAV